MGPAREEYADDIGASAFGRERAARSPVQKVVLVVGRRDRPESAECDHDGAQSLRTPRIKLQARIRLEVRPARLLEPATVRSSPGPDLDERRVNLSSQ